MFHLRAKLPRGPRTPHSEAATRKSGNRGHHPPNPGYSPLPVPRTTKKCSKDTGRLPARRRGAGGGRTSLRGSGTAGSPTPRGAGRGGSPQPSNSNLASRGPRNLAAAGAPGRSLARPRSAAPTSRPAAAAAQPGAGPSPATVATAACGGGGAAPPQPDGSGEQSGGGANFFRCLLRAPSGDYLQKRVRSFWRESARASVRVPVPERELSEASRTSHGPARPPPARPFLPPSLPVPSPGRRAGGRGARAGARGPRGACREL